MHLTCRAWAKPGDQDKLKLGLKGVKTGEKEGQNKVLFRAGFSEMSASAHDSCYSFGHPV